MLINLVLTCVGTIVAGAPRNKLPHEIAVDQMLMLATELAADLREDVYQTLGDILVSPGFKNGVSIDDNVCKCSRPHRMHGRDIELLADVEE